MAVYKNSYKIAKTLCDYVLNSNFIEDKMERQNLLDRWVNKPTIGDEGFTPLHFASFHGNLTMIKYLISIGGNPKTANRHSINLMHVAAQGD